MGEENKFDFMSRINTTIYISFYMHAPQITNEQQKQKEMEENLKLMQNAEENYFVFRVKSTKIYFSRINFIFFIFSSFSAKITVMP